MSHETEGTFVYTANFMPEEAEIAALELRCMANVKLCDGFARSVAACDISLSSYTRLCAEVLAEADNLDEIVDKTAVLGLALEDFAIDVIRRPPRPKLEAQAVAKRLADVIAGSVNLSRPRVVCVLLAQQCHYVFGRVVSRARRDWHDAAERPINFSNSLPPRLSRALVNLVAAPGDTLIDPCCGAGTVLIEAARMGVHACGSDLNEAHLEMARRNLGYFGCAAPLRRADAREFEGRYDAAVLDLPYGHTSRADDRLYLDIISRVAEGVERLVVVTGDDKQYLWEQLGLTIKGVARVPATNIVRHVYLLGGRTSQGLREAYRARPGT